MHDLDITRRRILAGTGGIVAAHALAAMLPRLAAAATKPVTVGFKIGRAHV